jgi:hypothetical protein
MENHHQPTSFQPKSQLLVQLHTVTPLSRYLSFALFIILPFLGGWLGYSYASVKVVEVEKFVMKEANVQEVVPSEVSSDQEVIGGTNNVSISFLGVKGWIVYALTEHEWEEGKGIYYTSHPDSIVLGERTVYTSEAGFDPTRVEIKKVPKGIKNVSQILSDDTTVAETVKLDQKEVIKLIQPSTINTCESITYLHSVSEVITGVVDIVTCPTHSEGYDDTKILVAESVKFSFND